MAPNLCPGCQQESMTWSLNESEQTWWHCIHCGYDAEEDESREKICPVCLRNGAVLLTQEAETFYWCVLCGKYRERIETER